MLEQNAANLESANPVLANTARISERMYEIMKELKKERQVAYALHVHEEDPP